MRPPTARARPRRCSKRLLAYKGVREAMKRRRDRSWRAAPVLPMHFRKGDTTLRLFTTIATLGTPQDVTVQELRVESFFPWTTRPPASCAPGLAAID